MYTKLSFTNFRGFKHLELDGLKRVNLIVGKNNAGKTSLLEGIALLSSPVSHQELPHQFRYGTTSEWISSSLWFISNGEHEAILKASDGPNLREVKIFDAKLERLGKEVFPNLIGFGELTLTWTRHQSKQCQIMSIQHQRTPDELVRSFASTIRSRDGKKMLEGLVRCVDPRITDLRLDFSESGTYIAVDLGLSELVPLPQAGQGVYRLIAIYSELLGLSPDTCLIDEIENGLHYTALPQVWQGLAEVAEQLDLQLFVTTHSNECLEAAHAAFAKREKYDFSVIQLMLTDDGVTGRVLGREMIETGLDANIDLR